MIDYAVIVVVLSLCLIYGAWREHVDGNGRDSKLMAGLGVCTFIGSVGLYLGTT